MLNYDNDSRRQVAREHTDRLVDEMRRRRRLTPDRAGYPRRLWLGEVMRRTTHLGRATGPVTLRS
jgi:hypothetical protein